MASNTDLPDIYTLQEQTVAVDFGNALPAGVTVTGIKSVSLLVHSGIDPTPASRLDGSPQLGTIATGDGGSGVTMAAVLQKIKEPLDGVKYTFVAVVNLSNGDYLPGFRRFKGKAIT